MSLVNTLINPIRTRYDAQYDKNEYRESRYGAWGAFLKQTNSAESVLSNEVKEKIKANFATNVEIPVIDYDSDVTVNVGSRPPLTIADDENTSQKIVLTAVDYWWGFTMYPAQYMEGQNSIDYQNDFNKKFEKYILQVAALLDNACLTKLDTDKTQVFNDPLDYTVTANIVKATNAQSFSIFGDLLNLHNANDFYPGVIDLIGNIGTQSQFNRVTQDRDNNVPSFLSGLDLMVTNRLTNAASTFSTGFAVVPGSLGAVTMNARDNKAGSTVGAHTEWGILRNAPVLGVDIDTFYKEEAADASALTSGTADLTQSKKETYIFSLRQILTTAYNSSRSTIPSPIIKFDTADPA